MIYIGILFGAFTLPFALAVIAAARLAHLERRTTKDLAKLAKLTEEPGIDPPPPMV